jgi:hypothetical protein
LANAGHDTRRIHDWLGHRSYEGFGVKGPVRIFFCFANR